MAVIYLLLHNRFLLYVYISADHCDRVQPTPIDDPLLQHLQVPLLAAACYRSNIDG